MNSSPQPVLNDYRVENGYLIGVNGRWAIKDMTNVAFQVSHVWSEFPLLMSPLFIIWMICHNFKDYSLGSFVGACSAIGILFLSAIPLSFFWAEEMKVVATIQGKKHKLFSVQTFLPQSKKTGREECQHLMALIQNAPA